MTVVVTARVPEDLAAWADEYAGRREVPRAAIVQAALEHFRGFCASGVPDLPEVRSQGRPKGKTQSATRPEPVQIDERERARLAMVERNRPRRIERVETTHEERRALVSERQAVLNDSKYGKGAW